jgi:Xaa-Pro aminopeptidase
MREYPYRRRRRELRDRLRVGDADACVLYAGRNLQYLTGFQAEQGDRHLLLVVPAHDDPVFVVPALYDEQVREATDIDDLRVWADEEDPKALLREVGSELGLAGGRVLVDDHTHARFLLELQAALDTPEVGLAGDVLGPMRRRKDGTELDALAAAAGIADATMTELRAMGEEAVGLTEQELARAVERRLTGGGGEGVSFETICASGPNGAKPHHSRSERTIERGDPVVLDFGTRVDGYASDTTRTVVPAGDPPEGFPEVHEVVRQAQRAGVEAIEPGVTAGAVDAAAREVIEAAGYGEAFLHRTGHGVGLDVHEEPYIVAGSDTELAEGMVFSVEPGVYLPGEFGVRIEDLVRVTETGCERLNTSDRGWR